jgi:hypothetical protein
MADNPGAPALRAWIPLTRYLQTGMRQRCRDDDAITQARQLSTKAGQSHSQATTRPDGTAFIYDDVGWTYHDVLTGAERLSRASMVHGVRPGDRVGLHMPNRPEMAVALYACFRVGAIACPANLRFKTAELHEIFQRLRPALYLGEEQLPSYVETIESEILAGEKRFVTGPSGAYRGATVLVASGIRPPWRSIQCPTRGAQTPPPGATRSSRPGSPRWRRRDPMSPRRTRRQVDRSLWPRGQKLVEAERQGEAAPHGVPRLLQMPHAVSHRRAAAGQCCPDQASAASAQCRASGRA